MKTQSIFAVALLVSAGIVFGPATIYAQGPAGRELRNRPMRTPLRPIPRRSRTNTEHQ